MTDPEARPEAVRCAVGYAWLRDECRCGGGHDFGNSYWTDVVDGLVFTAVDVDAFWDEVEPKDIPVRTSQRSSAPRGDRSLGSESGQP